MFNLLKSLYTKERADLATIDRGMMIGLTKWVSNDSTVLAWVKQVVPYQFYLPPRYYYYLLSLGIPKQDYRYFKTVKKIKEVDDKFIVKLQYLFGWSNRELAYNMPLIELLITRKDWAERIGVDK